MSGITAGSIETEATDRRKCHNANAPKGMSAAGLQEFAITSDHFEMGRMRRHLAQVWVLENGELEEPGHERWRKKRVRGLLI